MFIYMKLSVNPICSVMITNYSVSENSNLHIYNIHMYIFTYDLEFGMAS